MKQLIDGQQKGKQNALAWGWTVSILNYFLSHKNSGVLPPNSFTLECTYVSPPEMSENE